LSGKSLKLLHPDAFLRAKYARNAFAAGTPSLTPLWELTALPRPLA